MKDNLKVAQLLLRCALGITFLTPVLDRLGFLGPSGTGNIEWGNWENFISYASTLMPYFNRSITNVMGGIATASEFLIAIFLMIGFKTKYAALGSCLITLTFILFMATSVGIQKPINFGVFTAAAASFLLSHITEYKWSIDDMIESKHKQDSDI
jgi:putative oxidoreductase